MVTITAVELRKNLREYLRRAAAGEEIEVTYRGGGSVRLSPGDTSARTETPGLDALVALLPEPEKRTSEDLKELYSRSLQDKYGQTPA